MAVSPSPELLASLAIPQGVERINAGDRETWLALRQRDVTASNIAALFGEYEWFGRAGLWEIKTGRAEPSAEESWAMTLGNILEGPGLARLAAKHPDWTIQPLGNRFYYRDPVARIGATPDAFAIRPDKPGFGVVQFKTASAFAEKKWLDASGEAFCPTWVGMQAMTEAVLTGASWAMVATLLIGNGRVLEIDVDLMPDLWAVMKGEVAEFWRSVESGVMPEPDPVRDAKVIARIYADDDGRSVDLSGNNRLPEIIARHAQLKAVEAEGNAAAKERKLLDGEIIAALGTATSGVLADGTVITAKTTRRGGYTVQPTSYRTVKVAGTAARVGSATPIANLPETF